MTNANGQPMECDAVEARLLDLVYGELEGDEAGSVRAHAAGCESCARSLAKLEGGRAVARKMDTQEPPAAVMGAVLAAARAKAGENQRAAARARIADAERAEPRGSARGRAASRESREGTGSWIAEVLRKLGSFATGPQVAMALLLLLMVGIGLWSAPRMTERDRAGTTAVLEPDPDGEAGPSAGALTPAEPLRLEVDPRTDRIVEAETAERETDREGREARSAIARATPEAERGEVERLAEPDVETAVARARVAAGAVHPETPPGGTERSVPESEALAAVETELAPGEGVGGAVEAGALPEPTGSGASVATIERSAPPAAAIPRSVPQSAVPQSAVPQSAVPQPTAPHPAVAPTDDVESPAVDTAEALAASLHQQAREAGSSGRYAQCVSTYQQVLDRYPAYAQTGRALLEMSECQRRMGQITVAERTLQRAQRFAAVRADAERRLSTLRAERAAMDRAAGEAETRSGSAAAAEPASTY